MKIFRRSFVEEIRLGNNFSNFGLKGRATKKRIRRFSLVPRGGVVGYLNLKMVLGHFPGEWKRLVNMNRKKESVVSDQVDIEIRLIHRVKLGVIVFFD